MAKLRPKFHWRSSSHKSAHKIPKGAIHVRASFDNTIVVVIDVGGLVVS